LLAPSFLVVASAIACGQTSGGPDDPRGQGSSPTVGTSGAAGVGATSTGGTGVGAGAADPSVGATGVSGGYAGSCGACNPPSVLACPPTLPTPGYPCWASNINGTMCAYPGRSCASETAWCPQGAWQVFACPVAGSEGGTPSFGGEASTVAGAGGQGGAP